MKKSSILLSLIFLLLSCQKEKIYDIVVVGGGLMGSSTAWHLSNEGENVVLLEMQDSVYTFGSSQGEARIARSLGPVNDMWSYLHNRSVEESRKLITFLNEGEQEASFSMEQIYTTSPVSYVRHLKQLQRIENIMEGQTDQYEFAGTSEEARRIFDIDMPDTTIMIREYKEHSGTINPKALIGHLHTAILKNGKEVWYNHKVTRLKQENDLFLIAIENTRSGKTFEIKTRKVVSAAGPYTGHLLKDISPVFDELIHPERVFLAFFKIEKEVFDAFSESQKSKLLSAYPVINSSAGTRDGSFFSMIEKIDVDGLPIIKIGGHFQRSGIEDLDKVWQKELTQEEIEWGRNSTMRYLTMLELPLESLDLIYENGYSCVYSLTETEVPYVVNGIDSEGAIIENMVVLGGMSGVGAKGAMTYGLVGANLLLGKDEEEEKYGEIVEKLGIERVKKELSKKKKITFRF